MTPSYSIAEIAKLINAEVIGDDQLIISRLAPIISAEPGELTFLLGGRYQQFLSKTNASAVILTQTHAAEYAGVSLIVDNPESAFAKLARLFDPYQKPAPGIHQTATIASSAEVSDSASIGAGCVIADNVQIGENTVLSAGVTIGDDVHIGADCALFSNVSVYHGVRIGDRVTVHSGAVIGADGFGLTRSASGWEKMPQIGAVLIHDDVEIGANTCVDRGSLGDTILHNGVKIDNLVQIAHNVIVGKHTAIAGCVAIAGSTTIGANCMIGGTTGIAGHLAIVDGVVFTGGATVTKSVSEPGIYSSGTGLLPNISWRKMAVRLRQLDHFMKNKKK